jgi:hypothetical protein
VDHPGAGPEWQLGAGSIQGGGGGVWSGRAGHGVVAAPPAVSSSVHWYRQTYFIKFIELGSTDKLLSSSVPIVRSLVSDQ